MSMAVNDVVPDPGPWGRKPLESGFLPAWWRAGGEYCTPAPGFRCAAGPGRGLAEALDTGAGRAKKPVSWDGARKKGLGIAHKAFCRAGGGQGRAEIPTWAGFDPLSGPRFPTPGAAGSTNQFPTAAP